MDLDKLDQSVIDQLENTTPEQVLAELAEVGTRAQQLSAHFVELKRAKNNAELDRLAKRAPQVDIPKTIVDLSNRLVGAFLALFMTLRDQEERIADLEDEAYSSEEEGDWEETDEVGDRASPNQIKALLEKKEERRSKLDEFLGALADAFGYDPPPQIASGVEMLENEHRSLVADVEELQATLHQAETSDASESAPERKEDTSGDDQGEDTGEQTA